MVDRQRMFFGAMMLLWMFAVALEVIKGDVRLLKILVSFVFFQLCNGCLDYMLRSRALNLLQAVPVDSFDVFINTSISLLHSLLLSCSVATCLLVTFSKEKSFQRMADFDTLYSRTWFGGYNMLGLSCGYFAYDQVDMLRRHLYSGPVPPFLVHHWLLLNCFTLALVRNAAVNYLILTLICEMHSVFLHWRRVGRMLGVRKLGTNLVLGEWILNWTTFFITRMLFHIYIAWKVYVDAAKFPSKLELGLAASGMLGLNILNALLGVDLARAYFKEQSRKAV